MSSDLMIANAIEALEAMQAELRAMQRALAQSTVGAEVAVADDDDDDTPIVTTRKHAAAAASNPDETIVERMRRHTKRNKERNAMFASAMHAEMKREPLPRDLDIRPLMAHYEPVNVAHESLPLPSRDTVIEHIDTGSALDRAGELPRHSDSAQQRARQASAELARIKNTTATNADIAKRMAAVRSECEFAKKQLLDAQRQRVIERRHWIGMRRPVPRVSAPQQPQQPSSMPNDAMSGVTHATVKTE